MSKSPVSRWVGPFDRLRDLGSEVAELVEVTGSRGSFDKLRDLGGPPVSVGSGPFDRLRDLGGRPRDLAQLFSLFSAEPLWAAVASVFSDFTM